MILRAEPEGIIQSVRDSHPEIDEVLSRVRERVIATKREISTYQAAALYALTRPYNHDWADILEIGTAYGYSCAMMAEAAPKAHIVTLNPKEAEIKNAQTALLDYRRTKILKRTSAQHLTRMSHTEERIDYDLIFVDGDHKHVVLDLAYWFFLRPGGLFLFHDYAPAGSWRECPPVYTTLNHMKAALGRDFDVLVQDDGNVGIAGWYKEDVL